MFDQIRKLSLLMGKALVSTVFFAAIFHLVVITVKAISSHNLGYISPIDFLGIGFVFPSLADSTVALIWAWVVLIMVFFIMLYSTIHYRRYIGIVTQTNLFQKLATNRKVVALTKPSATATKVKPVARSTWMVPDVSADQAD